MADWQEEKRRVLEEARCIVFKVGSAVITDDQGLSLDVIDRLADQIAAVSRLPGGERRRIVLVTSGAVSAGRSVCRERGVEQDSHGMSARQAFAAIGQGRLVRAWDDAFRKRGLSTALILLTRDDIRSRERLLNIRNTFAELLSWGVVPIVNENDTVSIRELKFGDNDTLASLLVNLVGAELYVSVTTAPGVYDRNPSEPGAAIMESIPNVFALNLGTLCGGKTTLGTGGMYSKLLAARRAAQLGVPTYILPGREPDIIARAFASGLKGTGTWVCPRQHDHRRAVVGILVRAHDGGVQLGNLFPIFGTGHGDEGGRLPAHGRGSVSSGLQHLIQQFFRHGVGLVGPDAPAGLQQIQHFSGSAHGENSFLIGLLKNWFFEKQKVVSG